MPNGYGDINPLGIQYYKNLIRLCLILDTWNVLKESLLIEDKIRIIKVKCCFV